MYVRYGYMLWVMCLAKQDTILLVYGQYLRHTVWPRQRCPCPFTDVASLSACSLNIECNKVSTNYTNASSKHDLNDWQPMCCLYQTSNVVKYIWQYCWPWSMSLIIAWCWMPHNMPWPAVRKNFENSYSTQINQQVINPSAVWMLDYCGIVQKVVWLI